MGRHQRSAVPATPRQRLASELLGAAIGLGALAGVVALAVDTGQAQSVHADEIPQAPEAVEPTRSVTPAGGTLDRIFYFDDVVPWDPGKEPGLLLAEERTRSAGSAVTRANRPPEETIPLPAPAPNDPLRDDPPFGSGCEQPGTAERCDPVIVKPTPPPPPKDCRSPLVECECDHDPFQDCDGNPRTPPVGLPPVVVDETEEPPAEPAEEETPVDEVEVGEPEPEVAG